MAAVKKAKVCFYFYAAQIFNELMAKFQYIVQFQPFPNKTNCYQNATRLKGWDLDLLQKQLKNINPFEILLIDEYADCLKAGRL